MMYTHRVRRHLRECPMEQSGFVRLAWHAVASCGTGFSEQSPSGRPWPPNRVILAIVVSTLLQA
eukprot:3423770-Pleurochrysis_carterae.AAC.2